MWDKREYERGNKIKGKKDMRKRKGKNREERRKGRKENERIMEADKDSLSLVNIILHSLEKFCKQILS